MNAGRYERAIAAYREFLEVEPENSQAFCYLGDCYEQMDRLDEALVAFKRVIEIDNTDPEGWFGAGMIYHRMARYREAITYILKAIEFDQGNMDYWINLGYVNEDAGLIDEALKCYGYVTRMDAADLDGWNALTSLLMKEALYVKALNSLREAYAHHPSEASVKMKISICHLKMEEKYLARKFMKEALEADKDVLSEFRYFFPEGTCSNDIEQIIRKHT